MAKKMLVDASHPEETRVVVASGNRIEEFDFESAARKQLKGNIYLAKVTRVEPSLQAAFIEYGGNRHGFLAFSEIHPDYYQIPVADRQRLLEQEAEESRRLAEEASEVDDRRAEGSGRQRRRGGRGRTRRRERAYTRRSAKVSADDPLAMLDMHLFPMSAADTAGEDANASTQEEDPEGADDQSISNDQPTSGDTGGEVLLKSETGWRVTAELRSDVERGADTPEPLEAAPEAEPPSDHAPEATEGGPGEVASADQPGADDNGREDEEDAAEAAEAEKADEFTEPMGGDSAEDDTREEMARRPRIRMRDYKIQEVIKRRQIMLVQVVKEERGNKGAALTTYLSLAGRYCVLMPNTPRGGGISRKITNAADRKRLKAIAAELDVPEGMGLIIRTAGANRTKAEIKRDYEYLLRLWESVRALTLESSAPCLVYEEGSLIKRSIRDLYSREIDTILVEGDQAYREAKAFMRMLMPSHAKNVQPYKDRIPLFQRHQVVQQLDAMLNPQVQLPSGGYVVMNPTEALVAIDVNSGRSTREHNIEDTALKTNLEAAEEIARQLRLRDLAGLIVIDFIDMEEPRNNRAVERKLKDCLKLDRARIQAGRISMFGLLEMSRQRLRAGVMEGSLVTCSHCGGTGVMRSVESAALRILRGCEEEGLRERSAQITVRCPFDVAVYLLNQKRYQLTELEHHYGMQVYVEAAAEFGRDGFEIERGESLSEMERKNLRDRAISLETAFGQVAVSSDSGASEDRSEDDEASDRKPIENAEDEQPRRRKSRTARTAETKSRKADAKNDQVADGKEDRNARDRTEESEERPRRRRRGKRGGRRHRKSQGDAPQAPVSQTAAADGADAAADSSGNVSADMHADPADGPQPSYPGEYFERLTGASPPVPEPTPPAEESGSSPEPFSEPAEPEFAFGANQQPGLGGREPGNLARMPGRRRGSANGLHADEMQEDSAASSEVPVSEDQSDDAPATEKTEIGADVTAEPTSPPRRGWWQRRSP